MPEPWPDPDPPDETCGTTGMPVYTNRPDIGRRMGTTTPATTHKDVVIRPCPSCAGLHVTLGEPKGPPKPADVDRPRCKKRRYRTQQDALLTMKIITAPDNPARREQRAYRCPQCAGSWHLSSRT